jgi:hypothetical protein
MDIGMEKRFFPAAALPVGVLAILLPLVSPSAAAKEAVSPKTERISTCAPIYVSGGTIPNVGRGQNFKFTCSEIGRTGTDVRVVLKLDPQPGEDAPGYDAVMATEQTVETGTVRVRVPDVPGIANHTVDVKIFITDGNQTRSCDAGKIKIF